ncbi:unnamed protein product [Vitrella brassicaformis CCMP3155]|uniref:Uncharacterized protein n=1 Tax=Vitrella brassicaformis (strain CCMP3155) TaxID=1169540 RepID=A0A0G4E863_VITBC|nr:unnamed protein product [Vitrella brassicaformis CCMP3155]|eukprot:CEL91688.1 unnamed protein product [Vitrella brassicaformis CCMP3155]
MFAEGLESRSLTPPPDLRSGVREVPSPIPRSLTPPAVHLVPVAFAAAQGYQGTSYLKSQSSAPYASTYVVQSSSSPRPQYTSSSYQSPLYGAARGVGYSSPSRAMPLHLGLGLGLSPRSPMQQEGSFLTITKILDIKKTENVWGKLDNSSYVLKVSPMTESWEMSDMVMPYIVGSFPATDSPTTATAPPPPGGTPSPLECVLFEGKGNMLKVPIHFDEPAFELELLREDLLHRTAIGSARLLRRDPQLQVPATHVLSKGGSYAASISMHITEAAKQPAKAYVRPQQVTSGAGGLVRAISYEHRPIAPQTGVGLSAMGRASVPEGVPLKGVGCRVLVDGLLDLAPLQGGPAMYAVQLMGERDEVQSDVLGFTPAQQGPKGEALVRFDQVAGQPLRLMYHGPNIKVKAYREAMKARTTLGVALIPRGQPKSPQLTPYHLTDEQGKHVGTIALKIIEDTDSPYAPGQMGGVRAVTIHLERLLAIPMHQGILGGQSLSDYVVQVSSASGQQITRKLGPTKGKTKDGRTEDVMFNLSDLRATPMRLDTPDQQLVVRVYRLDSSRMEHLLAEVALDRTDQRLGELGTYKLMPPKSTTQQPPTAPQELGGISLFIREETQSPWYGRQTASRDAGAMLIPYRDRRPIQDQPLRDDGMLGLSSVVSSFLQGLEATASFGLGIGRSQHNLHPHSGVATAIFIHSIHDLPYHSGGLMRSSVDIEVGNEEVLLDLYQPVQDAGLSGPPPGVARRTDAEAMDAVQKEFLFQRDDFTVQETGNGLCSCDVRQRCVIAGPLRYQTKMGFRVRVYKPAGLMGLASGGELIGETNLIEATVETSTHTTRQEALTSPRGKHAGFVRISYFLSTVQVGRTYDWSTVADEVQAGERRLVLPRGDLVQLPQPTPQMDTHPQQKQRDSQAYQLEWQLLSLKRELDSTKKAAGAAAVPGVQPTRGAMPHDNRAFEGVSAGALRFGDIGSDPITHSAPYTKIYQMQQQYQSSVKEHPLSQRESVATAPDGTPLYPVTMHRSLRFLDVNPRYRIEDDVGQYFHRQAFTQSGKLGSRVTQGTLRESLPHPLKTIQADRDGKRVDDTRCPIS